MLNVVVLAAGMGKRMQSALPKVLHTLAGRPLLAHVLAAARALQPARLVVVAGHGAQQVRAALDASDLMWVLQSPQQGTGHAVMQALPHLLDEHPTLVLYGDVPLARPDTLARLVEAARGGAPEAGASSDTRNAPTHADAAPDGLALLTLALDDPAGYGRIVRGAHGRIERIVEHKDASDAERAIGEVNTGILAASTPALRRWLAALTPDNAQREYYLTDIVAHAVAEGVAVASTQPSAAWETLGVNDKLQLAALERIHQRSQADALMAAGVQLMDPARLDVRGTLAAGRDVTIDVGAVFEGTVRLGDGVRVGAYCVVRDAELGDGTELLPFSHVDGVVSGRGARIGPYARLRPGTRLGDEVHVGNFVEVKAATLAAHAKAGHLSYIGDAQVGERVNIGAGTITCNYDGANKHRTVIEDDVFVGSDTQLVAPVTVGRGATLGAGSTVTRDVPAGALHVTRAAPRLVAGWKRPVKS